jgi:hypothetical protein
VAAGTVKLIRTSETTYRVRVFGDMSSDYAVRAFGSVFDIYNEKDNLCGTAQSLTAAANAMAKRAGYTGPVLTLGEMTQ